MYLITAHIYQVIQVALEKSVEDVKASCSVLHVQYAPRLRQTGDDVLILQ